MKLILTNKITSIATMLSTNVLCIKTRRKRSYYVSEASDYIPRPSKDKRSLNATPGMMQITEDTPPDMLAGAMDLTVHLPTETTVKMSVDRSTPMMDLLVQITTAHHLQQSGHILQALEMAPSSGRLDKILPYKPNTPIGVLDTQHVKVIPKNRSIPVPKSVPGGHQPFESTFRLQVHLPRNQLYVIRVSQNVYLEDIMKKVCHEKNLDSSKFEFRHPANLDEVLNPKLTLSDYQITEVYVVFKGTIGLTQPFSANDIMASRKEEERKQMQARTGGGVLSLIFKRGKQSMGSGSISSENRSISPSHSDDSRSVTPPAIQQPLLSSRIQPAAVLKEKPKAPQRKRRPAPKPPQSTDHKNDVSDKAPSEISSISESNTMDSKKLDNGLTICHSRNSSDSSGYHEPSVLSDNCNTSLPRRSKSTLINEVLNEESQFEETVSVRSQNLTTMSNFSKSTSSIAGRKKKAAPPPPPPTLKSEDISSSSETVTVSIAGSIASDKTDNTETESAVAETVPKSVETESLDDIAVDVTKTSPVPMRRKKLVRAPPKPAPRVKSVTVDMPIPQARNPSISEDKLQLNAEENYNNVLNEASSIDTNKSINNDNNIKNNLTRKINHSQLTNDGEAALSKSILRKDNELVHDTPVMDLELEEPSASPTVKQDIFVVAEKKDLLNEDPVHINRLNSNKSNIDDLAPYKSNSNELSQDYKKPTITQEKQSPAEVCDFENAELEILQLKKSLDEKLNLAKCLPVKQDIFVVAEKKDLLNEDPVHINRLNSNKSNIDDLAPYKSNSNELSQDYKKPTITQEKQSPAEVCDFENAELEILQLKKSLDEKLNLAKCLPGVMENKNKPDVEISAEIPSGEYDLLEICDLALKEIEMLRDNSPDNITTTTNSDDLILLEVSDSNISKIDATPTDKNEKPVPKQRSRTKKSNIIPNNTSSENNLIHQDLSSTNNDKINNNQLVDATDEVSKYFEDLNSNYKEIGTNRKESIANASLSFESIGENVSIIDDNDKANNDQLVDVTLEVAKSSEGVIGDNKNTGTNNNESVTSASLSLNCIEVEQSTTNDTVQINNNQLVDIISEACAASENPTERRVSKSGSLSSSLDSIEDVSGINIGSSTVAMGEEDNCSTVSSKTDNKNLDNISVTSNCSLHEDIDIFETSNAAQTKKSFKNLKKIDSQTVFKRNSDEILHGESNSNEWNGGRKLNNIRTDVDLGDSTWTVGDQSETESAEVPQRVISSSNKNIEPIKRSSISSTTSLKSTDSEVIEMKKSNEVVNANLNCDNDRNTAITPKNVTELESRNSNVNLDQNCEAKVLKENQNNIKDLESQIISNCSPKSSVSIEAPKIEEKPSKSEEATNQAIAKPNVEELDDLDHEWQYQLPSPPKAFRDSSPTNLTDLTNYDTITLQDFKENSILSHTELFEKLDKIKDSQYENESISDFSSVCNDEDKPILSKLTLENLEKRQSLVYNRELSTSLKNAQENNFTSQTNRTRSIDDTNIKRSSVVNELEKVIKSNKPLVRHNSCIADTTLKPFVDNNLPNFKISTYDTFKRKINIFEDESIRSNSDNSFKPVTYNEISNSKSMPYESVHCFSNKSPMRSQNLSIAKSIENLSIVNIDCDEVDFKKPSEYSKHNSNSKNSFYVKHKSSTLNSAGRSESFSANKWIPQNPVQRSKSQIALNKFTEIEQDITFEDPSTLTKSNSLFDVSGLQSLEVIRSIQNKLNTPNNSTEDLLDHKEEPKQNSARSSISLDQDSAPIVEKPSSETTTTKTYRYQGPPSINLCTWTERPKTKVSLKEDTDYIIKNVENGQVRTPITTTGEHQTNGLAGSGTRRFSDSNSCTIQINGTEPIRTNQDSGNVTIKVGSNQFSKQFSRINKFMQNMENPFVRKPLGNINKIEPNPRPHSLPQDSDFDISRVPIVRAVELKKSIKETTPVNTSVTQINALNNEITNNNKYSDIYQSTERLQEINGLKNQTTKSSVYLTSETTHKPITRGNSFAYARNVPKVMGFTDIKIENDNTPRSRKSWNVPSNYEPLPLKIKPEPPVRSSSFLPNSNVPFSNLTLKRVESKKPDLSANNNIYGNVVLRNTTSQFKCDEVNQDVPNNEKPKQFPPIRRISNGANPVPPCLPPFKPIVPKKIVKRTECCADPRDELLNSIRNFGGQKGLRHVKAV